MTFGRRKFIIGSVGAGAAGALLGACGNGDEDGAGNEPVAGDQLGAVPVDAAVFAHGVASGDPLSDRVLLWTRVTVKEGSERPVELSWVIATDPELTQVVNEGTGSTDVERDYTFTVDADKLSAGTTYYYAFAYSSEARSVTGRTRTLPAQGVDHLRLVFTSCANYNNGYFNAYRAIANRADLDVWIHLGDYIYEYADAAADPANSYGDPTLTDRAYVPPNETITLEDYRARYAQYRRDKDLQEIHRQHPLIAVWDDHEVANNAWVGGAQNHMPNEGDYLARKQAGTRAFLEWVPTRSQPGEPIAKIYRSFSFGGLFDLFMLDTRLAARSEQVLGDGTGVPAEYDDPARTLIGGEQEQWLTQQLLASRDAQTIWRLVGNQVVFSPVIDPQGGTSLTSDFWEGYRAQRNRLIDWILGEGISNIVFMTGDIHTSWAIDMAKDPFNAALYNPTTGEGAFGVEFVGPSVTSLALEGSGTEEIVPLVIQGTNPQVKYSEVTRKGYVLLDVTPAQVQAEWYFVNTIKTPDDPGESLATSFIVRADAPHLESAAAATAPRPNPPALAPLPETASAALLAHNAAE